MTKSDRVLVILLRIVGVTALFAVVAVFLPSSWMAATHRWLGLGEMPTGAVVEYPARSLSAFYAVMGALCLVLTTDLGRYRPLARIAHKWVAGYPNYHQGPDLVSWVNPNPLVRNPG